MAFIEHSVNLYSGSSKTEKTVDFLKNTLGWVQDSENDMIFWCDDKKTVGLKISEGTTTVASVYAAIYTAIGTASGNLTFVNNSVTMHWQMSKDKDVIYLGNYSSSSSTSVEHMVFAKSDNGDWCAFYDNYMYHKNGAMYIGSPNITANSNTPFSAVKMPNLAAGGNFPNFYKFLTATSFDISGTYVDFGGEPYRAVCAYGSSSRDAMINYAFPVADES